MTDIQVYTLHGYNLIRMSNHIATWIIQVQTIFPDVILYVSVHDNGDDFLVIEVNHAWMFRFPRNPAAVKALACEVRVLPIFEQCLTEIEAIFGV